LFRPVDPQASDRGRAIHACFELVEWLEDGAEVGIEESTFDSVILALVPARDAIWRAERIAEFHAAIARPAIASLLTRSGANQVVRNEHRYLRCVANGIEEGSIDRLVLHRRTGC
jgi:hypothetical protein